MSTAFTLPAAVSKFDGAASQRESRGVWVLSDSVSRADEGLLALLKAEDGQSTPARLTPTTLDDAPEANVAGRTDAVHHENQVIDLQWLS